MELHALQRQGGRAVDHGTDRERDGGGLEDRESSVSEDVRHWMNHDELCLSYAYIF